MPRVTNIGGTAWKKCKCKSWLDHWYNHSEATNYPKQCSTVGCYNTNLVGAHVYKYDSMYNDHYIVPLCHTCKHSDRVLTVNRELVSANVSLTCGG